MTRRARRKLEVASALLAFPMAVALTVLVLVAPARSGSHQRSPADAGEDVTASRGARVRLLGGAAVPSFGLADRLAGLGYDVVSVGPDRKSLGPTTQVVYYQRSHRADAERLRDLLGVGTIRRELVFSPSTDLTILIGKDLQST